MRLAGTFALSLLLLIASAAAQTEWYVSPGNYNGDGSSSSPFGIIQQALAVAQPGDVITCSPGVYPGPIHLTCRGVTIRHFGSPDEATISGGGGLGPVVFFEYDYSLGNLGEDEIDGFTITGGVGRAVDPYWINSPRAGGGIYVSYCAPRIRNCIIRQNSAYAPWGQYSFGGGLCFEGANPTVENCVFFDNHATNGGAAIYGVFYHAPATFKNCLITGHTSQLGAAVMFYDSAASFMNCTIVNNVSTASPASDVLFSGGGSTLANPDMQWANCILRGTHATDIVAGGEVEIEIVHCDVNGGWAGQGFGNFDSDPLFENAAAGDFRLRRSSPCVDAGTASSWDPAATDLLGAARGAFGDAPDVGVFEFQAYPRADVTAGNVRPAGGAAFDVLRVNGESGNGFGGVHAPLGSYVTIQMLQPPWNPEPAPFVLWGQFGTPGVADSLDLPMGIGATAIMPQVLAPGRPDLLTVASTFGPSSFGLANVPCAPFVVAAGTVGLPPLTLTMQGVIFAEPGRLAVTNAVVLEIF